MYPQPTPLQFAIYSVCWLIFFFVLFRLDASRRKKKQIRELIPLYLRAYGPMTAYELRTCLNESKLFVTQQQAISILKKMVSAGSITSRDDVREFCYVVVYEAKR